MKAAAVRQVPRAVTTAPLIYRKKTVLEKFGISETTLRRWMVEEGFPRPRQLGPRAVGWVSIEVDGWLEQRPIASSGVAICGD